MARSKKHLSEKKGKPHRQRRTAKAGQTSDKNPKEGRLRAPAVHDHKNRLFIRLFSEPKALLELYNAVNGSHYTDAGQLIVNTLEDSLYLGMKNDVSFLIGSEMNLYEAQSTWNPNMPLRGLFYFARLFQGYVEANELDIYSRAQVKLPVPRYVVFYNGTKYEADRWELKLSDSFQDMTESAGEAESGDSRDDAGAGKPAQVHNPSLECTALVLNINFGHNRELMAGCRRLYEYSYLISRIRVRLSQDLSLEEAIDLAMDDCIREGILKEFLTKHRGEAAMDLFTEIFSEERHIRLATKDAQAKGRAAGIAEGDAVRLISLICRKLSKGKPLETIADEVEEDPEVIRPICEIARSFAPDYDYGKIYAAMQKAGITLNEA